MINVTDRSSVAAEPGVDVETERQITRLIQRAARYSDEQRYVEWMDLFVDDCRHAMITRENYREQGLYNFVDKGRLALQERVAYLLGVWHTPRGKTTHVVSVLDIEPSDDGQSAKVLSNVIVVRAAPAEDSKMYASGQYADVVVLRDGRWMLKERTTILDSEFLPGDFADLV